jgi:hypothetical protein
MPIFIPDNDAALIAKCKLPANFPGCLLWFDSDDMNLTNGTIVCKKSGLILTATANNMSQTADGIAFGGVSTFFTPSTPFTVPAKHLVVMSVGHSTAAGIASGANFGSVTATDKSVGSGGAARTTPVVADGPTVASSGTAATVTNANMCSITAFDMTKTSFVSPLVEAKRRANAYGSLATPYQGDITYTAAVNAPNSTDMTLMDDVAVLSTNWILGNGNNAGAEVRFRMSGLFALTAAPGNFDLVEMAMFMFNNKGAMPPQLLGKV